MAPEEKAQSSTRALKLLPKEQEMLPVKMELLTTSVWKASVNNVILKLANMRAELAHNSSRFLLFLVLPFGQIRNNSIKI